MLYGKKPSYDHLRVFGCLYYMSTCKQGKYKFQPRAVSCVFLGYPHGKKAYKVMTLDTHKFHFSIDVIFHEDIFPFASAPHHQPMIPLPSAAYYPKSNSPVPTPVPHEHKNFDHDSLVPDQDSICQQVRRSTRSHRTPNYLHDYVCTAHTESHYMTTLTNFCFQPLSMLAHSLNVESQQLLHQLDFHKPSSFE